MLSPTIIRKRQILDICENSRDLFPGDKFQNIKIAETDDFVHLPLNTTIVCVGPLDANEMLFSAGDGRYYFTVIDGWGEKNNVLYGLEFGDYYDFKHPTTTESAITELEMQVKPTFTTWGGAMKYYATVSGKKKMLDVLRKLKK